VSAVAAGHFRERVRHDVVRPAAFFGLAGAAAFVLAIELAERPPWYGLALAAVAVGGGWLFFSARLEWTLLVLALFVTLVEGPLKLGYGGGLATVARDLLLAAIVGGGLARLAVKRTRVELPPLSGFVFAWCAIVLAQVANPDGGTLSHSIQATRQHIEWVPLFFLGYVILRTPARLRALFLFLVVVATINGAVALVQYELGPDKVASWGPGYERAIYGGDGLAGRTFIDASHEARLRPFALGSDAGFGGALAVLAAPGVVAILAAARSRRRTQLTAALLAGGIAVAALSSQVRLAVIGTVLSLVAVVVVGITSRKIVSLTFVAALLAATVYIATTSLSGHSGIFDRYSSIAGSQAVATSRTDRGGSLSLVPRYAVDFPLGTGLGSVGAATSVAGAPAAAGRVSGESELNFLLVEVGIPGLAILLAFTVVLVSGSIVGIRRMRDPEQRLLVAALLAPVAASLVMWLGGPVTAGPPMAPYFWLAAGGLAYWCFRPGTGSAVQVRAAVAAPVVHPRPHEEAAPAPLPAEARVPAPAVDRIEHVAVVYPRGGARYDGIAGFADGLLAGLRADGTSASLVADLEAARPCGSDAVLLQYNPFSYGHRGVAPRLPPHWRRVAASAGRAVVVVHEPYVAATSPRFAALQALHRAQLHALLEAADAVVAPSADAARRIGGEVQVIPVGSNLPDRLNERRAGRQALGVRPGETLVATFSASDAGRSARAVRDAVRAIAAHVGPVLLLRLGRAPEPLDDLGDAVRVVISGPLPPQRVASLLATADLFLAPYADGVTTRRTTLMAALQHGLPVVGTDNGRSDEVLVRSPAIARAPLDAAAFAGVAAELAADRGRLEAMSMAARVLYLEEFAWDVIAQRYLALLHGDA
jgi:glycosyltransferase involved in cell wall biosynthesis